MNKQFLIATTTITFMAAVVGAQETVTPPTPIIEGEVPDVINPMEQVVELPPKEIVDIDEPLSVINPITLEEYEVDKAIALAKGKAIAEDGEES
jgi:hypothetical protein